VDLACLISGPEHAPPLVLLHALGERATDWDVVAGPLSARRRVYAVDLRGHGDSAWPGEYSLELMRDDVLALLDGAGLDAVDLIGHSMGGVVAYLVAAAQPRRVRTLVLEDVPVPRPRPVVAPERPDGELEFDWAMVLAVRRQLDDPDPAWLDDLARITAPTLVIWGRDDRLYPAANAGRLARELPHAKLEIMDTGHSPHQEKPRELLALLIEFLEGKR